MQDVMFLVSVPMNESEIKIVPLTSDGFHPREG